MSYVTVWTLRRGIVNPPERLDVENSFVMDREAVRAGLERNPPLTQEQWWAEEGRRCGYERKRRVA